MISVIIPYYNRSLSIKRTLNSVLNQSVQDFEIIIVDDCSSDSEQLKSILLEINDQRVNYIRHPINKNGSSARNTGINNAKGIYVAFMDSDDEWNHSKLESDLEEIEKHNKDDVIIYGSVLWTKESSKKEAIKLPKLKLENKEFVSDYLFINDGLLQTSTLFMTKKTAITVQFNELLWRHQDYGFVLDAESKGYKFVYNGKSLTVWYVLDGDNCIVKKGATLKNSKIFLCEYKDKISKKAMVSFILNELLYVAVKQRIVKEYVCVTVAMLSIKDAPYCLQCIFKKIKHELKRMLA